MHRAAFFAVAFVGWHMDWDTRPKWAFWLNLINFLVWLALVAVFGAYLALFNLVLIGGFLACYSLIESQVERWREQRHELHKH